MIVIKIQYLKMRNIVYENYVHYIVSHVFFNTWGGGNVITENWKKEKIGVLCKLRKNVTNGMIC